jgi:hypothetical protein
VDSEIPNPAASSAQVRLVRRNAITSTACASGDSSRHRVPFRSCRRRSDPARSSQVPALTLTPARNRANPVAVSSGVNDVP